MKAIEKEMRLSADYVHIFYYAFHIYFVEQTRN